MWFYNHTSEGNQNGPQPAAGEGLCRALLLPKQNESASTRTSPVAGNTIAANRPLVRRLITSRCA